MTLPRLLEALRDKQAGRLASRIRQLSKPRNVDAHPVTLEAVLAVLGGSGAGSDVSEPSGSSNDDAEKSAEQRSEPTGLQVCEADIKQLQARVADLETSLGEVVHYLQQVPVLAVTSELRAGATHLETFTDSDPGDPCELEADDYANEAEGEDHDDAADEAVYEEVERDADAAAGNGATRADPALMPFAVRLAAARAADQTISSQCGFQPNREPCQEENSEGIENKNRKHPQAEDDIESIRDPRLDLPKNPKVISVFDSRTGSKPSHPGSELYGSQGGSGRDQHRASADDSSETEDAEQEPACATFQSFCEPRQARVDRTEVAASATPARAAPCSSSGSPRGTHSLQQQHQQEPPQQQQPLH